MFPQIRWGEAQQRPVRGTRQEGQKIITIAALHPPHRPPAAFPNRSSDPAPTKARQQTAPQR
ncbi:hypothetical protein [Streptomyces virginiae]|uniref:hypothetical protein n=1 Tax=Streptomyces virginiae TaxID=1961 RepID=UPI00325308B0